VIASLLTTFEWSELAQRTVLWIQSVYVRKESGDRAFLPVCTTHPEAVETSETLRGIRLYADKTNTGAHAVYEKMGMSAEHYQLYEWLKN
jgi:hypothetical protein